MIFGGARSRYNDEGGSLVKSVDRMVSGRGICLLVVHPTSLFVLKTMVVTIALHNEFSKINL